MNCQTQRALQGGLDDRGKMAQPSPLSAKPQTNITPALKKAETKTVPSAKDTTPTKVQPIAAATKAISTGVSSKDVPQVIPTAKVKEAVPDKAEKLTSDVEKKPSEAEKVDPHISSLPVLQDTAVSKEEIPKNLTIEDKTEPKKTNEGLPGHSKTEQTKPIHLEDHNKQEVISIETRTSPVTDKKEIALSSQVAEMSAPEEISEEFKPNDQIEMPEQKTSLQQIKSPQETKAVPAAKLEGVTCLTDGDTLTQKAKVHTKDMELKVRLHFLCTRETVKLFGQFEYSQMHF